MVNPYLDELNNRLRALNDARTAGDSEAIATATDALIAYNAEVTAVIIEAQDTLAAKLARAGEYIRDTSGYDIDLIEDPVKLGLVRTEPPRDEAP